MVGLAISMHFQQFEYLKFLFFPGEHAPGPPPKSCRVSNRPELSRMIPILLENPESRLNFSQDTKYPNFEEQLSQANEQRNIFLLIYHKICHKINKPLNLDIQTNAELQSWWITQGEYKIKSHKKAGLFDRRAF